MSVGTAVPVGPGGTYPVRVEATLDTGMSRWLWLVKWLLAIPHYVVLFFLWIAFVAVSVVVFFAILFTGRYPPRLFGFNRGVLRWTWRVSYYTYGALGTDRYPPFTLADVPDYPARLDVEPPERLSRGLVLVKWWLLALPHYLVVGILAGGGSWTLWELADTRAGRGPGLIGLLVVVAAVVLLFTGRYPQPLFDLVLGLNRWVLRVAAYAGLMTDEYPPFRLDLGGPEPGGTGTVPPPPGAGPPDEGPSGSGPPEAGPTGAPLPSAPRHGWRVGGVVAVVVDAILGLASLASLGAGGVATWATHTQRDRAGYLTSTTRTFATPGYAVTSEAIDLGGAAGWVSAEDVLGTVRIRATATDRTKRVFLGVGPQAAVDAYLGGVDHLVVTDWADGETHREIAAGADRPGPPDGAAVWTAQASGPGTQALSWRPSGGRWVVVVMNPDGGAGVSVTADAAATLPVLGWIAAALLAVGAALLIGAVVLITVPVMRARRRV